MGKNANGSFTPPKGKPTGNGRESNYDSLDEVAVNVPARHANRHFKRGDGSPATQISVENGRDMEAFSASTFNELATYASETCITIYLPTHPSGVEVNEKQDAITYKNALQSAASQLQERGHTAPAIEQLLTPGYEFYETENIWNRQSKGLAVFISKDYFQAITLPYSVKEEVFIGESFMVMPMLDSFHTEQQHFYVLTLSKQDARFYEGDGYGLKAIEITGLPNGVEDVVHTEEKSGQQLFRQASGGKGGGNVHGHGPGHPGDKENVAIYFKEVDKTLLAEKLRDQQTPLVLAGVEYLIPIYRENSRYQYITDVSITGNQDYADLQSLYEEALPAVKPYFDEPIKKALKNYYNQISTALTSSIPETVIPAAYYGKISDLFICRGSHIWGTFNETDNKLIIHADQQPGDICLISGAAVKTLQNGGAVYMLDKERMPKDATIAAFLRYA